MHRWIWGAAFRAALGSTTVRIEYALEGGARWVDESRIAQSPDGSQELKAVEVMARHEVIAELWWMKESTAERWRP